MELQTKLYTASEFLALADEFDPDKRYELVNGEIVEMLPTNRINSLIAGLILTALNVFIIENNIEAYVFGADGAFALDLDNVRIPDASLLYKARMPDITDMKTTIAPDIAVEVISPSETPRKINEKTALYLNNGARLVWNIFPQEKVVEVWTLGTGGKLEMQPLSMGDTVSGGEVLPGFVLPVAEIFANLQ